MIKPVIFFSYIGSAKAARNLSIAAISILLNGCFGGTLAQQLVRSIATSVADNAVANAMDVNEQVKPKPRQNLELTNRPPSDLALAISRTSFKKAEPQLRETTIQLNEKKLQIIKSSALVSVKVFNIIIGQEKNSLLERARMAGAFNVPTQEEWHQWHIATGEIINSKTPITFIVPPNLGKPVSGSTTVVELANIGDINIARYHDNQDKLHQAMDERK
jgi:hypothetical protein